MRAPFVTRLPTPAPGRAAAERFVANHLAHLTSDEVGSSSRFRGGQSAADAALAAFDVTGYAARRNEVLPVGRRGASGLSPYIRHGMLSLPTVWRHVAGGPSRDVQKFRDELLWQEYARHWYARLGAATQRGVRHEPPVRQAGVDDAWDRDMRCVEVNLDELYADGWLVNQTRMWLASQWTVRSGAHWRAGEDEFFRHLLDGSRAANRLGWQWVTGAGSSKVYGFSRRQVERRAPSLCAECSLRTECPIEEWPDDPDLVSVDRDPRLRSDDDVSATAGPAAVESTSAPSVVWLTAESLGADDPALVANPDLPVVFVFDEPLLATLQLSSKRLVFLVETLAELAEDRAVELRLGRPEHELADRPVAVTFSPVPGFRKRQQSVDVGALYPWLWLQRPAAGSVASFSAWRRSVTR
ncbi:MAG: FAD-binding domain-containing protein [Actinomycetota bacterium]